MFKKTKIGDVVRSPNGNMEIIKFHINGFTLVKQRFPPFKEVIISSFIIRSYPIVERPGSLRSQNRYKTFEGKSMSPAYVAWKSIKKRTKFLCPEWADFQIFAEWFYSTRNAYSGWELVQHDWMVAFDLLDPSNRTASPETCCVVPFPVKAVLSDQLGRSRSNNLPRGLTRMANRYVVQCSRFDTGTRRIGSYSTLDDARDAYWSAKIDAIRYTAITFWQFMPEPLAMRMISFNSTDVAAYFGKD